MRRSTIDALAPRNEAGVLFGARGAEGPRVGALPNGVRVATERTEGARSLSIGVFVDVGPEDEPAGQHGVAHLSEHLLFQGTTARSALDIARAVDAAGGRFGSFTARDYTCFFADVTAEGRETVFDLVGDCLLDSTFPVESLERQREALLCELASEDEPPRARLLTLLRRQAWVCGPLGRSTTGTRLGLRNVGRDDVVRFVRRNYTPDRIVVAVAGDVEHEDVLERTDRTLRGLHGRRLPRTPAPGSFHPGLTTEGTTGALAHFALGIPCGPSASADASERAALASILGGGLASRLSRRLVVERGLASQIEAKVLAYRRAGVLLVRGSCAGVDLVTAMEETAAELEALATGAAPVEEGELVRCRARLRAKEILDREGTRARVKRMGTETLAFGVPSTEAETLARIDELEVDSMRHYATFAFRKALADAAVAVLDPIGPSRRLEALSGVVQGLHGVR